MLSSPGWRSFESQKKAVAALSAGLVVGSCITGTLLLIMSGLAEIFPLVVRIGVVAALGVGAILRDLNVIRVSLPQRARLIPRSVFERGYVRGAWRFGIELGTGVRTYVSASTPYFVAATVLLLGSTHPEAWFAGLGFGVGRAIMVAARYRSRLGESWDEAISHHMRWMVPGSSVATLTILGFLVLL